MKVWGHREKKRFLPCGVNGYTLVQALVAAGAMLALLTGGLDAVAAPVKAPPEEAMFTAYLPYYHEEYCLFRSRDGRIGYGFISRLSEPSVFAELPAVKVIPPSFWGRQPSGAPPVEVPITLPDFDED